MNLSVDGVMRLKEAILKRHVIGKGSKASSGNRRFFCLYTFNHDGKEHVVEGVPVMLTDSKSCHVFHACAFIPHNFSNKVFQTHGDGITLIHPNDVKCRNLVYSKLMKAIDRIFNPQVCTPLK